MITFKQFSDWADAHNFHHSEDNGDYWDAVLFLGGDDDDSRAYVTICVPDNLVYGMTTAPLSPKLELWLSRRIDDWGGFGGLSAKKDIEVSQ